MESTVGLELDVALLDVLYRVYNKRAKELEMEMSTSVADTLPSLFSALLSEVLNDAQASSRLLAVLESTPTQLLTYEFVSVAAVRLLVANGLVTVFHALRERVKADMRKVVLRGITSCNQNKVAATSTSYTQLIFLYDLELLCIQDAFEVYMTVLRENMSTAAIHYVFKLMGLPYVFQDSVLDAKLQQIIKTHKPYEKYMRSYTDCKREASRGLDMQYARLDLSPTRGSLWLRELIVHDHAGMDAEELQRCIPACVAMRLRWHRFTCVKRLKTKHDVLFAVVDGLTLVEFAVRRAAACSASARTLLYCITYMVLEEHPKLLSPQEMCNFLGLARHYGLQCVYNTGMDTLQSRILRAFSNHNLQSVADCVASGFPAKHVVPLLSGHPLRVTDVTLWRVYLKQCLTKYDVNVDMILEHVIYEDDDM